MVSEVSYSLFADSVEVRFVMTLLLHYNIKSSLPTLMATFQFIFVIKSHDQETISIFSTEQLLFTRFAPLRLIGTFQ